MKKVLTILLVIAIVLALAAAAGAGYIWYKNNHVFVEGDAYPIDSESLDLRQMDISVDYYDQLQALLPRCRILWNVPFQGAKHPSDTRELTVASLTGEDAQLLRLFPELGKLYISETDAHTDYDLLAAAQETYPDCALIYQVNLGGDKFYPLDSTELALEEGDYEEESLLENLKFLPGVTTVIRKLDMTAQQDAALEEAYPDVEFRYLLTLNGQEYGEDTTQMDLSGLTAQEALDVSRNLGMLPNLETVELMNASGESQLTMEDVKQLQDMAPEVSFHYTFEFYGDTISTTDEEVYLSNKKIGNDGLPEVRKALDIMENCRRFVLENCKISNEELAKLREEYRDRTNVVWRVYFGEGGSCLTDREVIKAVYGLTDANSKDLIYCEGARFCDFGHNEYLNSCEFVSGMPNLEAIILSGSPIKDLEGFRNCKKLKFLELAFCGYIKDVSPLEACESLEMLNISATKVGDIKALYDLPMTLLSAKNLKLTEEDMAAFQEKNPECWTSFQREGDSVQPYGQGWRYDKNDKYLPYYEMLRDKDHFYYEGPIMNTTRW